MCKKSRMVCDECGSEIVIYPYYADDDERHIIAFTPLCSVCNKKVGYTVYNPTEDIDFMIKELNRIKEES